MRALAAALALAVSSTAAAATIAKDPITMQAYVGGTVEYRVEVTRSIESNLVIHDPIPAGHTVLSVRYGSDAVDCTQVPSGALGALGGTATCNAGGETQIAVPTALPTYDYVIKYRVDVPASTNVATLTCSVGCPLSDDATIPVAVAPLAITKSASPDQVRPGDEFSYDIVIRNTGTAEAVGAVIVDDLPAGLTLVSVQIGGTTYAAGMLPSNVTLTGQRLEVRAPAIPAGQPFPIRVTVRVPANATDGTRYDNTASVTAAGGSAVASAPVTVTVSTVPDNLDFDKQVLPKTAKIDETVTYTLTATAAMPFIGPLSIEDPFDSALEIVSVSVGMTASECDATVRDVGPFKLNCGSDRRHLLLELPPGVTAPSPIEVKVQARVLPIAGMSILNEATLIAGARRIPKSDPLTIMGVSGGPTLTPLLAGRTLASKGDLVPFSTTLGMPNGAAPIASATLRIRPGRGLRVGSVLVAGAPIPPVESGDALTLPLGAITGGTTTSIQIRTRVGQLAKLGRETIAVELLQDANVLATAPPGEVRIIAEPEFDLGTIVGEVWRDDDGDGQRDRGEKPIEGALVVMDDGLQATTDADGRYHLSAIVPGERAIKVTRHTLPPDSKLTTDETRVIKISPGILVKINFGVKVPTPEPPTIKPAPPSEALPELRVTPGGLLYNLVGRAAPGARVSVDGVKLAVDKSGGWKIDLILKRGRTRVSVVTEFADGRVVFSTRDVFWTDRDEGGSLIVPRAEEPRLTLRFPAGGALAEPTFLLEGMATAPMTGLIIAGTELHPDAAGKVAVRLRVPEAGAGIPIEARFSDGLNAQVTHELAPGDFWMLVGIAEGKLGYVQRDANLGKSGLYAEGRVKLYAKGRIQGRWLLEGGLNIDSTQIEDWRDIFRGDPSRVFRNLDPDKFYTVYGDSSQVHAAAQSRARLFVRIQLDKSELLLGNLQTGLTGVEFGRYSRAVTGGRISFVRAAKNPDEWPSTQVIVFGAWLQTARAHDELRGTGGSLYYLSHRYVVEGSEQVRIELRDRISNRPISNGAQRATVDYEVDYLAGRITLREPLGSVSGAQTLVRSGLLDGDRAYVVVDYEYVVAGESDEAVVGGRVTQRIGPVQLGVSAVNEFKRTDYTMAGGDLRVDLKKYGAIIGEFAFSQGSLNNFARSDDGGLTYANATGPQASDRKGYAWKGEADLHFGPVSLRPYVRGIDQGFTDTAHSGDAGLLQFGGEVEASFWKMKLRLFYDEKRWEQQAYDAMGTLLPMLSRETRRDGGGEIAGQFGRWGIRLGARTERSDDAPPDRAGHRTAIAARVEVGLTSKLTMYIHGQYALEHDGLGLLGRDNSLAALGSFITLPLQIRAQAEINAGPVGFGGQLSLKQEFDKGRVLYGTVTLSQDRDDRVAAQVAAGGRQRVTDRAGNARAFLFAEDQFRDGPLLYGGRAHMQTAGVDLPLAKKLMIGSTFERGEITPSGTPLSSVPQRPTERTAATLQASYGGDRLRAQVRGEIRHDVRPDGATGQKKEYQWLASGMITWKAHKDLTFRGKVFFSNSTSPTSVLARSSEATVGFAWRPSWTERLALFGRYTYLDEGVPAPQGANAPALRERAHVMSLAGEGRVVWRISLAEKIAAKRREEPDLGTADWFILWVNRASLHVTKTWDAVVEYRLLYGPAPVISHGVALELNRIIVGHLRLGAGWNFADFSDDERRLGRGSENGFFIRAQGFY